MAGQRLTDKTALEEQTGSGDLFMVVDSSDTTGSAAGTSKKIDSKFVIQTDKISVTNTEVVNLHSTPRTLVGALSGYMITVLNVNVLVTYASSTEASSNDLYFGYDDSSNSYYWKYLRDFMNLKTDDLSYSLQADNAAGGTFNASLINKPFIMWSNAAFTGGWSCEVYITYAYTKIL